MQLLAFGNGLLGSNTSLLRAKYKNMKDFEVEMPVTAVAKGGLWVAYLCAFSDAVCFTYIFAFLPYYVEFLLSAQLPSDSRDSEVAYHSGILGSSYSAGQVLSAFLAGSLSDKVGRRPVLIAGSLATVVTTAVFGLLPSFTWAVVVRFLVLCT